MSSFLWCDHCLMLSKIQGHVAQFVLMSSPSVCVHVPFLCAIVLGVHFCLYAHRGCVCAIACKITAILVPLSSLGASRGYAWPSRVQRVRVNVCVCVHTLHPSQLPHMSTPHHIPGATAAITVTKEPANSFITQSTTALMTP